MLAYGYLVGLIVCAALPLIVTVARFWVRGLPLRKLNRNEYTIILSQFLQLVYVGLCLTTFIAINYAEQPSQPPPYLPKIFYSNSFFYFGTLWSIKFSINLLYLDLSANSGIRPYCVTSMVFLGISAVVVFFLQIFECWPLERRFVSNDSCQSTENTIAFWIAFALNIFTDCILFIMPFPLIRNITQRPLQLALTIMFTLAIFVIVMSSIRGVFLVINSMENLSTLVLLSNIEIGLAMIIACLPGLSSPLTRRIKNFSSSANSTPIA